MTMSKPQPDEGPGPYGHVNMTDVARLAGVSVATVSRALRDVSGVSEDTRTRVREVAAQLAYVVSPEASSLAKRVTSRVAVVVPRIDIWFYATLLGALERGLRASGLDVLVYQVDGHDQRTRFVQQLPARRKVDAVVLVSLPLSPEESARLGEMMGTEVVVAGGHLGRYTAVHTDDHAIACAAVGHLADHGHRRIAMIRTDDTTGTLWSPDLDRRRGYEETVAARGLDADPELVVTVPYGLEAGATAMQALLDLPVPPTAVFAYSDELALAALSRMYACGVRVPEDVSLVGVDGHPTSALFGLDTVDQDVPEQGRIAAEMVTSLLAGNAGGRQGGHHEVVVPHRLVERGSTTSPRAGHLPRRRRRR